MKTIEYIPKNIFSIADAKRGDIGNTSKMYAKTFFETMDFNSITVNPYMGSDSVEPFLDFNNKWVILLALTSNKGSEDFQNFSNQSNIKLYQQVLEKSMNWSDDSRIMYVVGATKSDSLKEIRKIIPDHFLLIPGIGAQGGSLDDVVKYGMNKDCGLLINSSRSIIYAGHGENFADNAREAALKIKLEMENYLS